jgi:bis(5'-nucleosyl)-tetraphosphatase (symmetrical)
MLTDQGGAAALGSEIFSMAVYAVGDVQGCYEALGCVLQHVGFDPQRDRLWLVGDIVNRGPQSLEVLRFVHSLGPAAQLVLGNHEVHLLAVAAGVRRLRASDTLTPILNAPDRQELLDWLARQPLLHVDESLGYCMVHAGLLPNWSITEALALAREAQPWLLPPGIGHVAGPCAKEPEALAPELSPAQRARVIIGAFTRLRVCTAEGRMEWSFKGPAEQCPPGLQPWFAHTACQAWTLKVIFGHWAALHGQASASNVFALDTGCAWGRSLTVMRLEDERRYSCSCQGVTHGPD